MGYKAVVGQNGVLVAVNNLIAGRCGESCNCSLLKNYTSGIYTACKKAVLRTNHEESCGKRPSRVRGKEKKNKPNWRSANIWHSK